MANPGTDAPASPADPKVLGQAIYAAASTYGVDGNVLAGMMYKESGGFQPDVVSGERQSPKQAIGIAQFVQGTADRYGIDPKDPIQAIFGAAKYLSDNLEKFNGNYPKAIAAYNWGENRAALNDEDWQDKLPAETKDYVSFVTQFAQALQGSRAKAQASSQATTPQALTGDPFIDPGKATPMSAAASSAAAHYTQPAATQNPPDQEIGQGPAYTGGGTAMGMGVPGGAPYQAEAGGGRGFINPPAEGVPSSYQPYRGGSVLDQPAPAGMEQQAPSIYSDQEAAAGLAGQKQAAARQAGAGAGRGFVNPPEYGPPSGTVGQVVGALKAGAYNFIGGEAGVVRAAAELIGATDISSFAQSVAKAEKQFANEAIGPNADSVVTQAISGLVPMVSLLAGNAAGVAIMATDAAGEAYSSARDAGESVPDAISRAGFFGAANALSMRFRVPAIEESFATLAAGKPTAELGAQLASALTTNVGAMTSQTVATDLYDKFGMGGQRRDLSLGDLLNDMVQTAKVAAITTAVLPGLPLAAAGIRRGAEVARFGSEAVQARDQAVRQAQAQRVAPSVVPTTTPEQAASDVLAQPTVEAATHVAARSVSGPPEIADILNQLAPPEARRSAAAQAEAAPEQTGAISPELGARLDEAQRAEQAVTGQKEPEQAAPQPETAPIVLPQDKLSRDGEPYGAMTSARAKAHAEAESGTPSTIVTVPDYFGSGKPGYIVRPVEAQAEIPQPIPSTVEALRRLKQQANPEQPNEPIGNVATPAGMAAAAAPGGAPEPAVGGAALGRATPVGEPSGVAPTARAGTGRVETGAAGADGQSDAALMIPPPITPEAIAARRDALVQSFKVLKKDAQPYLVVGDDGKMQLGPNTPAEIEARYEVYKAQKAIAARAEADLAKSQPEGTQSATREITQQAGIQPERQAGNEVGPAAEAGGRNSVQRTGEGQQTQADQVVAGQVAKERASALEQERQATTARNTEIAKHADAMIDLQKRITVLDKLRGCLG